VLFLHTDGLADARRPGRGRIGEAAIHEALQRLPRGADADIAVAAAMRLVDGLETTDDIAIVALSVGAPG